MESDELGNDLVRMDDGFLVDEETYAVNSDDVLDDENNSDSGSKHAPLREQDRFLPIANIAKIMKRAIPYNGKIAKDARECLQECISEFISFVTSEASDRCQVEKRKTINGEDVLFAMNSLGFDSYVEPLKIYLKKYREIVLSPITINGTNPTNQAAAKFNKLSKTIIIYGDGTDSTCISENGNEVPSDSAVLYAYPKTAIDDYNIS